ncbi:MAG: ACT domain-containing protein [Coriobacteriia bacterium]|nr:ACT domain-containing protein [Coriobacteriia bacterium]
MIDQLTVFLENRKGRLAALCRALGDAGFSMRALTIADTERYGVVRIITKDAGSAQEVLTNQGFRASLTSVLAVEVPDIAGGLAKLLEAFEAFDVNIEYAYCFSSVGGKAIDVLRVNDEASAMQAVASVDYRIVTEEELFV